MAGNIDPVFPKVNKAGWATLSAANTAKDGTGVVQTICTGDDTNGSYVEDIRCIPIGTNVATVLRVFLNNGSSSAVAANNTLWYEKTLPLSALSEVAEQVPQIIPLKRAIPPGYKLNVCLATAVAAGVQVTCAYGDY